MKPATWCTLAGALGAWLALAGCNAGADEQKAASTPTPAQHKPAAPSQTQATPSQSQATPAASQEAPAAATGAAATPLLNPKDPMFQEQAPESFKAKFETTKGAFVIEVHRAWSPRGADRFYHLVQSGFFDGCKFFRVVENFMVQFGMSGDPKVTAAWRPASILDDAASPSTQSNKRGYITFAKTAAPNSRTTQVFINFKDNAFLDSQGFTPFGVVTEGMESVVDKLYKGYGDAPPRGQGPDQGQIMAAGNEYLNKGFPDMDGIVKATIVK